MKIYQSEKIDKYRNENLQISDTWNERNYVEKTK